MKNTHFTLLGLLLLCLVIAPSALALAPPANVTITSQLTAILANQDYSVTYRVNDSAAQNDTVNITTLFYVNGVNVANYTRTNVATNATSNSYTDTFDDALYARNDVVYANITTVEYANSTQTNWTITNSLTVGQSSAAIIQDDTLDGLPATGTFISDFLRNVMPGVFAVMIMLGIATGLVLVVKALGDRFKGNFGGGRK